jgi:hypothetical protein
LTLLLQRRTGVRRVCFAARGNFNSFSMHRFRPLLSLAAALMLDPGATGAAEPSVIALPPYLVEEAAQRLPWRYADVAGLEVLSSCPERLTRDLIANHHRLHALLAELVPPALQLKMTEKRTLIFVESAQLPPTSQEVMAQMALTAADQERLEQVIVPLDDGRLRRRPPPPRYTFLPNLRLWDRDGQVLFAVVRESEYEPNRVALTPDYVAYVLRNRLPALPPWYVSGVLTLFARARFTEDALTLDRLDWLSAEGSAALQTGPAANRPLLPGARRSKASWRAQRSSRSRQRSSRTASASISRPRRGNSQTTSRRRCRKGCRSARRSGRACRTTLRARPLSWKSPASRAIGSGSRSAT